MVSAFIVVIVYYISQKVSTRSYRRALDRNCFAGTAVEIVRQAQANYSVVASEEDSTVPVNNVTFNERGRT